MNRPNFFIAGAPRAGTTALFEYLREHPQIFLPNEKEIGYFADDMPRLCRVSSTNEYLEYFRGVQDAHRAIGEATVMYLYSDTALKNIYQYDPQARIIVLLRNPVDLIYSIHGRFLAGFEEDEEDFETAWNLQDARARGERIPQSCLEPSRLQYGNLGRLGEQVKRLLDIFPRQQVLLLFFDDLCASPRTMYEQTLEFLEVDQDGRTEFPRINENRAIRNMALNRFTERPPWVYRVLRRRLQRLLRVERFGILARIRRLNTAPKARPPLSPAFRNTLLAHFEQDINLLEELTGRDLSSWKRAA